MTSTKNQAIATAKLEELVNNYIYKKREYFQNRIIRLFVDIKRPDEVGFDESHLEHAIVVSARKDTLPHASHVSYELIENVLRKRLIDNKQALLTADKFDELFDFIEKYSIKGIDPMTLFEIAVNLGCYLGKTPNKLVYLHRGALKSARLFDKAFGLKIERVKKTRSTIYLAEHNNFPKKVRLSLNSFEISDFLYEFEKPIKQIF